MAKRSDPIKTLMAILVVSSPVTAHAQPAATPPAPPPPSAPANTEDQALARGNALHDIIASNADTLILYWTTRDDGKPSFLNHVPMGNPEQISQFFDKLTDWGDKVSRDWILGTDKLPDTAITELRLQTADLQKALASAGIAMRNATFGPERLVTTHPFIALMGTIQLEQYASTRESKATLRSMVVDSLRKGRDQTLDLNEKAEKEVARQRQLPADGFSPPGPAFGPPANTDMRLSQPL